jgi:hypothetical protein
MDDMYKYQQALQQSAGVAATNMQNKMLDVEKGQLDAQHYQTDQSVVTGAVAPVAGAFVAEGLGGLAKRYVGPVVSDIAEKLASGDTEGALRTTVQSGIDSLTRTLGNRSGTVQGGGNASSGDTPSLPKPSDMERDLTDGMGPQSDGYYDNLDAGAGDGVATSDFSFPSFDTAQGDTVDTLFSKIPDFVANPVTATTAITGEPIDVGSANADMLDFMTKHLQQSAASGMTSQEFADSVNPTAGPAAAPAAAPANQPANQVDPNDLKSDGPGGDWEDVDASMAPEADADAAVSDLTKGTELAKTLTTAAETDAALGGPEDPIGDIAALAVGLGGIFGSIFGIHKPSEPKAPQIAPLNPSSQFGV